MEKNIDFMNMHADVNALNPGQLAYIGDAVYEVYIRYYLLSKGIAKPYMLSEKAKMFVNAQTQSKALRAIMDMLNEEERKVVFRGRNSKHKNKPASATVEEYNNATGLEALIGYLYLNENKEKLSEIISAAIQISSETNKEQFDL